MLADAALTLDELDAALADEVGAWAVERCMPAFQELWPRWRQAVDTAANRGVLCFGPVRDRKVTYTSPQRWSPGFAPAPAEEALAWLLRSYLHSYGPARPEHLAQWLSAPRPWAESLFQTLAAAGEIEPVGAPGWVVAGDTDFPGRGTAGAAAAAVLRRVRGGLPSAGPRLPRRGGDPGAGRRQAGNYPVLLLGGVVGGVWHQKPSGRHLDVTVEPLTELSAARRRALDAEVQRVAAFQGRTARLTIGPVTVGPHA